MSEAETPTSPIESYVKITLDSEELNEKRIHETFRRFHTRRNQFHLEVRLVADDGVSYYVGTTEDTLLTVEHAFRELLPDGTTFDREQPPGLPDEPTAALTVRGRGERHDDWQTRLRPVYREGSDSVRMPLATVANMLAETDSTVVYQAVLTTKADWRADAQLRKQQLMRNRDTPAQRFFDFLGDEYNPDPDIADADPSHQARIHSIESSDPQTSFSGFVRAIAQGPDDQRILGELGNACQASEGEFYRIDPRVRVKDERVEAITERIRTAARAEEPSKLDRVRKRFPLTSNADAEITADPLTAPNFCLFDGSSLTDRGRRAMGVTPDEQTAVARPPSELLAQYDSGMLLGYPLTDDDTTSESAVSLPPSLQPLHTAWFGKTGSGKSTALINAMLENHGETDGADILIDPKGDGMPIEYLSAHYAEYGTLENVYYFDCAETLPAVSFFDIRDRLADGVDRTTAVEDVTDHYIEILTAIMGADRFERAVRSPDIIRYLVKAMFDPVHGDDVFGHSELQAAATRMRETRDAPPVVDDELQRMLSGVAANSKRSFDELMQGVANRIEKIPLDDRLGELFNHVPSDDDPRFDLRDVIDEDAVVILDTGGLRPESRRVLTLVVLSQLWAVLGRRTRTATDDVPLVNLYLEEAATVATSGLVSELLAQSRAFGLSMTLAMQFPAQLRQADSEAYAELLNNVSTIVTGNVAVDADLKKRLATEDMPPDEVANRLRAIRRGQWFVSLPSKFGRPEPRPFLLESAPIPAGHPESDVPLSSSRQTAFEIAFENMRDRTRLDSGLKFTGTRREERTQSIANDSATNEPANRQIETAVRSDSLLPYTKRLPEPIEYDSDRHALSCSSCDSRYDPTVAGMKRAIECCHSLDSVHRDDIPACELNLKLSVDERIQSPYTDAQLRFLHAVYAAHQRRFDAELEYDLLTDSMHRLQEYAGIEQSAVNELIELGLVAKDCQYPHVLYTVTPEGRKAAKIRHREGIAHGAGAGDLSESSFHVAMVILGIRYIQAKYVDDPDSPIVEVSPYHEVDDGRLDVAGLDENGEVVVAVEAERSNHDTRRAVPDDFDKMAAEDPDAAIWIVKNRDGAHDVLEALNDPPEGEPRVERTYSRSSPPQRFSIETAGLTEIHSFTYLRDSVLEYSRTE